jgi:ABC-type polysaccharide/polyol phosphate export permease
MLLTVALIVPYISVSSKCSNFAKNGRSIVMVQLPLFVFFISNVASAIYALSINPIILLLFCFIFASIVFTSDRQHAVAMENSTHLCHAANDLFH